MHKRPGFSMILEMFLCVIFCCWFFQSFLQLRNGLERLRAFDDALLVQQQEAYRLIAQVQWTDALPAGAQKARQMEIQLGEEKWCVEIFRFSPTTSCEVVEVGRVTPYLEMQNGSEE